MIGTILSAIGTDVHPASMIGMTGTGIVTEDMIDEAPMESALKTRLSEAASPAHHTEIGMIGVDMVQDVRMTVGIRSVIALIARHSVTVLTGHRTAAVTKGILVTEALSERIQGSLMDLIHSSPQETGTIPSSSSGLMMKTTRKTNRDLLCFHLSPFGRAKENDHGR